MDALSKLVGVFCISILAITYSSATVQLILLSTVIMIAILHGRQMGKILSRLIKYLLFFSIPFFLVQLVWVSGQTVVLEWGWIQLTAEATHHALVTTCRLLTLFLSSAVYIATTETTEIVRMLTTRLRVPYRFAYAVLLALRFLPMLTEEAQMIRTSHQIRGMRSPRGIQERARNGLNVSSAILMNAVRRMQLMAQAMDAKGFGAYSKRTYVHPYPLKLSAVLASFLFVLATIFVLYYV